MARIRLRKDEVDPNNPHATSVADSVEAEDFIGVDIDDVDIVSDAKLSWEDKNVYNDILNEARKSIMGENDWDNHLERRTTKGLIVGTGLIVSSVGVGLFALPVAGVVGVVTVVASMIYKLGFSIDSKARDKWESKKVNEAYQSKLDEYEAANPSQKRLVERLRDEPVKI